MHNTIKSTSYCVYILTQTEALVNASLSAQHSTVKATTHVTTIDLYSVLTLYIYMYIFLCVF